MQGIKGTGGIQLSFKRNLIILPKFLRHATCSIDSTKSIAVLFCATRWCANTISDPTIIILHVVSC